MIQLDKIEHGSRVLITGGFGFIGNEVVRQLNTTHELCVLDNGFRVASLIDDIKGVATKKVDLCDVSQVEAAMREFKPQIVIHLAAIHFIPDCNAFPERTLNVNVGGTECLLRLSSQYGAKHFLFASSGAVYGDMPDPLQETSLIAPVDIYGWSKWFGEELCRWHAEQHSGMYVTAARLFNVYGPRETNAHIIPEIIQQLRQGDTLRLGNISTRRDYVFVGDMAHALVSLALREVQSVYDVVNICSGAHASVKELIDLIKELLGRDIHLVFDESRMRHADKLVQVGNNTKLSELIGWVPGTSLNEGLKELLIFEGLLKGL